MNLSWLPNAICIVRIVLVGPIVWALLEGRYLLALLLIVTAGLSDGVDGFLARYFNWRTRLGSLLDPTADKLLLVSVFVTMTYIGLVPVWLAVIVVLRDLIIVAGASVYQFIIAPVAGEPSAISKLNTTCQLTFIFFTLTAAIVNWPPPISITILGAAVFFTSVVSGFDYVISWTKRAWWTRTTDAA